MKGSKPFKPIPVFCHVLQALREDVSNNDNRQSPSGLVVQLHWHTGIKLAVQLQWAYSACRWTWTPGHLPLREAGADPLSRPR